MHVAHTAVLMREHGIERIFTRDTDFHRFPFLETVDPTDARRARKQRWSFPVRSPTRNPR